MMSQLAGVYQNARAGCRIAAVRCVQVRVVFVAGHEVSGKITYTRPPRITERNYIVTDDKGIEHDIVLSQVENVEIL